MQYLPRPNQLGRGAFPTRPVNDWIDFAGNRVRWKRAPTELSHSVCKSWRFLCGENSFSSGNDPPILHHQNHCSLLCPGSMNGPLGNDQPLARVEFYCLVFQVD